MTVNVQFTQNGAIRERCERIQEYSVIIANVLGYSKNSGLSILLDRR